jgi:hypothetical protein
MVSAAQAAAAAGTGRFVDGARDGSQPAGRFEARGPWPRRNAGRRSKVSGARKVTQHSYFVGSMIKHIVDQVKPSRKPPQRRHALFSRASSI